MKLKKIIYLLTGILLSSCQGENFTTNENLFPKVAYSIVQQPFDWENDDFMPTPKGTTPIPTPWIGMGSLLGTYDLDVINDRKKSEGWVLLYNSFTTDSEKFASNPYFILYNKYRGIMRVFYYITDSFITTSSNIIDKLSISSFKPTKMFNFADREIVNGSDTRSSLSHIQPKPFDGSMPVTSHRWYMAQYEIAYDPSIPSTTYDQIYFNFNLNYKDIADIKLNLNGVSELKGTIGEQSDGELSKALNKLLLEGGNAAISNVSYNSLKKIKDEHKKNPFGINDNTFDFILKNLGNIASSSLGGVWGAATGLLNSMLFGTKTSPTPLYATINTKLKADGNNITEGALPSMPITFYVPGTDIPSSALGRIPLYNKPLGVFNIKETPSIFVAHSIWHRNRYDDPYNPGSRIVESNETLSCGQFQDYSIFLQFNPEVEKIADFNILRQQVFAMDSKGNIYDQMEFNAYNSGEQGTITEEIPDVTFYLYFAIEIKPKDGSPSTIISKTFSLKNIVNTTDTWLPDVNE
ncbi:MAG: hypothetical protein WAR39_03910 [Prevotella sp.]